MSTAIFFRGHPYIWRTPWLLWLYITLHNSGTTSLYLTLQNLPLFYFILLVSTLLYHVFTSLYVILHYSSMALLHSTWLYVSLPLLYFTLDSILTVPWLHFTPLDTTLLYLIVLLSTKICITLFDYIILPWLYFALDISTTFQAYHSSTSLCVTLHYSTTAIFHSTITQLDSTLLFKGSISLYLIWLYCLPLWLYFTLLPSIMALLHSTWLYCLLP